MYLKLIKTHEASGFILDFGTRKSTITNIFILTSDQMTACYVKGIAC